MSIVSEAIRIRADRDTIREKLVEFGIASDTDNLTRLATIIENIINQGAINGTVTENGTYEIPIGYHNGLGGVTVNVKPSLQNKTITSNGLYSADNGYDGFKNVTVNVPDRKINLQNKTVTENGTYTADSGYDGLGNVTVDVASSGGGGMDVSSSFKSSLLGLFATEDSPTVYPIVSANCESIEF